MRVLSSLLGCLLGLLVASSPPVYSRSFPSTPDATEAAQQRWGTASAGSLVEGCWWRPPVSGTTVQVEPCVAFGLEGTALPALKGFTESAPRSLTFSGGDGRYWVGGRTSPGLVAPGWTCLDGMHYCWVKSPTPPAVPSGLVLLAQTTVSAGLVGEATLMAPLRRATPYVVPAGVTLVLGACPEVPRRHLFDANGATTGLVRFGPGACGEVYPEWWGADPTGLANSTAAWQQTIDAVSGISAVYGRIPIACEGVYQVTGPLTIREQMKIHGGFKVITSGDKQVACQFNYVGTGDLFFGPNIGSSYADLDFRFLRLVDVNGTADKAFNIYLPTGLSMDNIYVQGFNIPYYWLGQMIYSRLSMLGARMYRQQCLVITSVANFASVEVHCGATSGSTVTTGVSVGLEPGVFGTSTNLTLRASVEANSGLPIQIARVRALNAQLYVEQPGPCANYSTAGAIYLRSIEGGHVHLSTAGNCQGTPPIPIGLRIPDAMDGALPQTVPNTSNLTITGRVFVNDYTFPVYIEPGPGQWGIHLTGLEFEGSKAFLGAHTTGVLIGTNYWTHGGAPGAEQGRGSTFEGSTWILGDLIQLSGAGNEAANMFWQVTTGGNPPQTDRLLLTGISDTLVLAADTTPSVRKGNTYMSRLRLEAGSAITMLDDPIGGLCVDLKADGARTLVHSALLRLLNDADYPMTAGNTLRLCADGPSGPWREYGRCSTCVP